MIPMCGAISSAQQNHRHCGGSSSSMILRGSSGKADYLEEAQERNFIRWPILGMQIWRSTPGWDERDTYQAEVDYLKEFIVNRLDWMDEQLAPFDTTVDDQDRKEQPQSFQLYAFPNPFSDRINIQVQTSLLENAQIDIYNLLCQHVRTFRLESRIPDHHLVSWDGLNQYGEPVAGGVYFCAVRAHDKILSLIKI
jgi:hypothetical protein